MRPYGKWGTTLPEEHYAPIRRLGANAAVSLYDKGYREGWSEAWDLLENDVAEALGISNKTAEEGQDFIKLVKNVGRRLRMLEKETRK